ncbi:MAG: VOC family protein [Geobacter sp.]|nr:VOC family protein [Geobacter sp.]
MKQLDQGVDHWERLFGYRQVTEPVRNSLQRVRVIFLEKEGSVPVKLVEPTDPSSPVWTFALKGGGLHHLCFRAQNLEGELVRLVENGARVLVPPQPGEAFEMGNISFVYAGQGLNIEIVETDRRARRICPS